VNMGAHPDVHVYMGVTTLFILYILYLYMVESEGFEDAQAPLLDELVAVVPHHQVAHARHDGHVVEDHDVP
jgi:hypothetical protein